MKKKKLELEQIIYHRNYYTELADEMEDAGDARRNMDVSIYRERVKLFAALVVNFQREQDMRDDD